MSLQPWQRANILAAANYLRELRAPTSGGRPEVIHQGLLEVLDPARRVTRLQRKMGERCQSRGKHGTGAPPGPRSPAGRPTKT